MTAVQVEQVRRFNRLVAQRVGALEDSYLRRGRPLGQARLLFEIGPDGADVGFLRERLGLDSGYLSRLLRALEAEDLIEVGRERADGRRRRARLTAKGRSEYATYDRLSDELAGSLLAPLDPGERARLVNAMAEVERLIRTAAIEVRPEPSDGADARWCLQQYFGELAERFEGGFDPAQGRAAADQELRPPAGLFLVARLQGRPVGCGGLRIADAGTGEVKRMWTAPSARGNGVARRILRAIEARARELELSTLRLETNRMLTEAQTLYRSEGYTEVEPFNDLPYAHHWFSKRL